MSNFLNRERNLLQTLAVPLSTYRISIRSELKVHVLPFNFHLLHGFLKTKFFTSSTAYLIQSLRKQINQLLTSLTFAKPFHHFKKKLRKYNQRLQIVNAASRCWAVKYLRNDELIYAFC